MNENVIRLDRDEEMNELYDEALNLMLKLCVHAQDGPSECVFELLRKMHDYHTERSFLRIANFYFLLSGRCATR